MSTWRRLANEQFPELKDALVPVDTPNALYFELSKILERALDSNDGLLAQRVLSFALWGITQTKNEQFVHGTTALFRQVIESESRRTALWRALTPTEFAKLKGFFIDPYSLRKTVSAEEIEREYRFIPRPNPALNRTRRKRRAG